MADFGEGNVKPLFSKGPPLSLKLAVFALLSLGLMFAQRHTDALHPLDVAIDASIQPIQFLAGLPDKLSVVGEYFTSRQKLLNENKRLQQQQLILDAKVQKLASLRAENEHIRKLLQSSKQIKDRVSIAQILEASPDPYRHYIMLNKGSNDGVYKGQALIDSYGIMGQVVSVSPSSSTAILITDANNGIPVSIERNGLQTVAEGSGSGLTLQLPYLPSNTDIRPGDMLVSSGLGGRYPAGYPVGTVTHVEKKPGEHFLSVQAKPAAHLHREREVLLVWNDAIADSRQPSSGQQQKVADNTPSRKNP